MGFWMGGRDAWIMGGQNEGDGQSLIREGRIKMEFEERIRFGIKFVFQDFYVIVMALIK